MFGNRTTDKDATVDEEYPQCDPDFHVLRSELAHQQELAAERDRRYQERWEAQQLAITTGMTAADTAVRTALVSAEKAVEKAEKAADLAAQEVQRQITVLEERSAMNIGSHKGAAGTQQSIYMVIMAVVAILAVIAAIVKP